MGESWLAELRGVLVDACSRQIRIKLPHHIDDARVHALQAALDAARCPARLEKSFERQY